MFTIVHMLKNGDLEVFRDSDILYTETGMTITVRSLSPFAVAYRTRPAQEPSEPDAGGSGSSNNGAQTSASGQQTAAGGSTAEGGSASAVVPQTSDPLPLEALVVVALLAAAAIVVLLIVRRKTTEKAKTNNDPLQNA